MWKLRVELGCLFSPKSCRQLTRSNKTDGCVVTVQRETLRMRTASMKLNPRGRIILKRVSVNCVRRARKD